MMQHRFMVLLAGQNDSRQGSSKLRILLDVMMYALYTLQTLDEPLQMRAIDNRQELPDDPARIRHQRVVYPQAEHAMQNVIERIIATLPVRAFDIQQSTRY